MVGCPILNPSCFVCVLQVMALCIIGNLRVSKMAAVFKPIIRWAQSKERVFLTLELSDVQVWYFLLKKHSSLYLTVCDISFTFRVILLQYPAVELTSNRLVFQGKQASLHYVFQGALIIFLVHTKT